MCGHNRLLYSVFVVEVTTGEVTPVPDPSAGFPPTVVVSEAVRTPPVETFLGLRLLG